MYYEIKDVRRFMDYYLSICRQDYKKRRAQKVISILPFFDEGERVLDVGCGGGFYSLAMCKRGVKDITLLDVSRVCVKAAKLNLLENGDLHCEGIVADATHLPFKDKYFDLILCIDVIEHIAKDHDFLLEIKRVLKNNGFLVLSTQNNYSINYFIEMPIQRYVLKNRGWMGWDPTHVRFYNIRQLCKLLEKTSFYYVKVIGTYFIPYMIALWFRKFIKRSWRFLYNILLQINDKLETRTSSTLNLFGWGIILLCKIENREVRGNSCQLLSNLH